MTLQQQEEQFNEFVLKMRITLFSKGNDYANEDRLSNFKLAGNITGIGPKLNALNLIATKVARLGSLLNGNKTPNNESINDSLLDLANYVVLLNMIINEETNQQINK